MDKQMVVFFSNRVEKLYDELKQKLFAKETRPFTKRYVIVPSPSMKNWLMTAMADDPDLGIAAGVHITHLDAAVTEIISKHSLNPEKFPCKVSETELAIKLEVSMRSIIKNFDRLNSNGKKLWQPLVNYLLSTKDPTKVNVLSSRANRRILTLSYRLAHHFNTYGNFGSGMLKSWLELDEKNSHWQAELWKRCVNEVFPDNFEWKKQDSVVHLFGLSFIPKQQHSLLTSLSQKIPVYYYLLSPCNVYWSEILSDRECRKLVKFWKKKGLDDVQQHALEEYIYDRNTLLANLGRVGREMAMQVENSNIITKEVYELPRCFLGHEKYSELLSDEICFSDRNEEMTLLHALQADLLLMRNASEGSKVDLADDRSIQLLRASTPMREVQTIYDIIVDIIQKHCTDDEPILPEDVIVMAPDIVKYEPYIRSVFSQDESKLDYKLMDLNILSNHSMVQGFIHLLSLAESRWDVSSILQLFETPSFQKKHGLSLDDIGKINEWIKAADVRWGEDTEHRREVLCRELEEQCTIDSNPAGTWKRGIERLLLGAAMILPDEVDLNEVPLFPLNNVSSSQLMLFGKWLSLMKSIRADLKPLADGSQLTLKNWSTYLKCLLESYFDTSISKDANSEEVQSLLDIIHSLKYEKKFEMETFSFSTINHHLQKALERKRLCYRESHLHTVKFCSMLPMRTLPAKVVIMIGMSEDNYPRAEINDSLNLLKSSPGSDYCPSHSEFDRYLFLETILSARRYYILSYCGYSRTDGKENPPSLLVSELFSYLDSGYTIANQKPSEICQKQYPFYPYDKMLFEPESKMQSYSQMYYKAALAHYKDEIVRPAHSFVPSFIKHKHEESEIEECVEIMRLSQLARNPIEAYFKGTLGMYLREVEDSQKRNEEDFVLNPLENAILKKNTLKKPLEMILDHAEKEGKLPIGPFRDFSIEKLRNEVEEIKSNFHALGIDVSSIFSIHCSDEYDKPDNRNNGEWFLPPLEISYNGKKIKIVGKISEVSEQGMIAFINDNKTDVLKEWPRYLVYLSLVDKYQLPFDKKLIFSKCGKAKEPFFKNPNLYLERYLDYYFSSLRSISPLIPEWVPVLVEADSNAFETKLKQTLSEKNNYFYNDYVKWIQRGSKIPDHEIIFKEWKNTAEELFGDLYQHWYSKRKSSKEAE